METIWPRVIAVASLIPGSTHVVRENVKKFFKICYENARVKQLLQYVVGGEYTCAKIKYSVVGLKFRLVI